MGCDIHACIEAEEFPGQERPWLEFAQLHLWRHYKLFGLLAGLRGPDYAIVEPRGFPPDMYSEPTGDHTPSWLTAAEYRSVLERSQQDEVEPGPDYWAALTAMEELEKRGKKTRLVFNFDS